MVKQSATLDTSFWINAYRAGLIADVLEYFELRVSYEVAAEMSEAFDSGREFWKLVREGVITRVPVAPEVVTAFGRGEHSAMNLAIKRGWLLLIDDRRPLMDAQRLGIGAICSPALVTMLFCGGYMDLTNALDALARLAAINTVSPTLLNAARGQLEAEASERQ